VRIEPDGTIVIVQGKPQPAASAATTNEWDYVKAAPDRTGRQIYYYFYRHGKTWRLPGHPLSEEFVAEYRRLLAYTNAPPENSAAVPIDKRGYAPGSFGALVNDYLASSNYRELKPRTKAEYKRLLEILQRQHGHKPVSQIRRRHVRKMRDEKTDTPGAANTVLRMLKLLLSFAVKEEWIEASPAAGMKLLKVGEWCAWTDEKCKQFEARWAPGTMERRAYALAVYAGQRKTDLVAMARAHRKHGSIRVVQSKTGEELWIPEHHELTAELGRGVAGITTLLTTSTQGKAFDEVYFGAWFCRRHRRGQATG
jgi:hypothetical protein